MLRIKGFITYVKQGTTEKGDTYTLAAVSGLMGIIGGGDEYLPQSGDEVQGAADIKFDSKKGRSNVTLYIHPVGVRRRPLAATYSNGASPDAVPAYIEDEDTPF